SSTTTSAASRRSNASAVVEPTRLAPPTIRKRPFLMGTAGDGLRSVMAMLSCGRSMDEMMVRLFQAGQRQMTEGVGQPSPVRLGQRRSGDGVDVGVEVGDAAGAEQGHIDARLVGDIAQ